MELLSFLRVLARHFLIVSLHSGSCFAIILEELVSTEAFDHEVLACAFDKASDFTPVKLFLLRVITPGDCVRIQPFVHGQLDFNVAIQTVLQALFHRKK